MGPYENWKDVVGFEGLYEVSDWGRIRSKDRVVSRGWGTMRLRSRILKSFSCNGSYGHQAVKLYSPNSPNGKSVSKTVHRIVLTAFVGEPGIDQNTGKPRQCRHLDGDPSNNHISNLVWGTSQENMRDRDDHGRTRRGEEAGRTKLTADQVREIRELLKQLPEGRKPKKGEVSMNKIGIMFGVDVATIRDIRIGRTWKHLD